MEDLLGLVLFVRVVLVCRHHDGRVPRLCSFAERSETAATDCSGTETETAATAATACDTMRWVGMIARRAGAVRQGEFSVPVLSVVCPKCYTGLVAASHS